MEQLNYAELVPNRPPDGLIPWLKEAGYLNTEAIVYRAAWITDPLTGEKKKMVRCVCSGCGEVYYLDHVAGGQCSRGCMEYGFYNYAYNENIRNGDSTVCPECGCQAVAVKEAYAPHVITYLHPVTIQEIGGKLVFACWLVMKEVGRDGEIRIIAKPYEAYIPEGKKVVKLCGYVKFMYNMSFRGHWEQRAKYSDGFGYWGNPGIPMPWDAALLDRTDVPNVHLDKYIKDGGKLPVRYLNTYVKHKNAENLVMQGMSRFLDSDVVNIDWKKKRPNEMLGLTVEEFRRFKRGRWGEEFLRCWQAIKEAGAAIPLDDVPELVKFGWSLTRPLWSKRNPMRYVRYLVRQGSKAGKGNPVSVRYLTDYWDMAGKIGWDLTDPKTELPSDLIRAHDAALARQKFEEKKALKPLFKKRAAALAVYELTDEELGLFIRPARTENELIIEGKALAHCVARYATSHAQGKTAILFVRKIAEPEKPYFTLELDEKTGWIRQNRGKNNTTDKDKNLKEFEEKFAALAVKIAKERKDGKSDDAAIPA